jgi:hypothetical protein
MIKAKKIAIFDQIEEERSDEEVEELGERSDEEVEENRNCEEENESG